MNLLKLILIAFVFLIGFVNSKLWHHDKPHHEKPPQHEKAHPQSARKLQGPIHDDIIKNAEHLTETLAKVQRTAESNRETRK